MTEPDIDVTRLMFETVNTEWSDVVSKPPIRLRSERKTNTPGETEYLHFSEVQERNEEWADGPRNTLNFGAACFAEYATNQSRDRREEVYREVVRICRANRDRLEGLSGAWDTLDYSASVPNDDEIFGAFPLEFTFTFSAKSRTPEF